MNRDLLSLKQTTPLNSHRTNRMEVASQWLDRLFRSASIRNKIVAGYLVAIVIAGFSTLSARLVEEYANEVVEERAETVEERAETLNKLNLTLLEIHDVHYRLLATLDRPDSLEGKIERLIADRRILQQLLQEAREWSNETESGLDDPSLHRVQQRFSQWLDVAEPTVRDYTQQLFESVSLLEDTASDPDRLESGRQALMRLNESDITVVFGDRLDTLVQITYDYTNAKEEAVHDAYEGVEELESLMLSLGLLVTVVSAVVLALFMGAAIARPLEQTTEIAKRAIAESNFKLQAPVITGDEAGQLTVSLNQLMQHVSTMLSEIQKAQVQLVQTEKMSSLGQLVAGIAHEINNPVNFIHGNIVHTQEYAEDLIELIALYRRAYPQPTTEIEAALDRIDLDYLIADWPKLLKSMQSGTERIDKVVRVLRTFSRLDESEVKPIDLHESLDSTLLVVNSQLKVTSPKFHLEIVKNYGTLPKVECYAGKLNQVFLNLIENAIDALQSDPQNDRPILNISTDCRGGKVYIEIQDNGSGIPPEIQNKIFDPFFTTKPVGRGTGLGLSTCYDIVRQHQGQIEISSHVDRGTEVTVILPVKPVFLSPMSVLNIS